MRGSNGCRSGRNRHAYRKQTFRRTDDVRGRSRTDAENTGPTQRMAFGANRACMPKTVRAEGPGDRPAKGAALVTGGPSGDNRFVQSRSPFGPTGQGFPGRWDWRLSQATGWPVGPRGGEVRDGGGERLWQPGLRPSLGEGVPRWGERLKACQRCEAQKVSRLRRWTIGGPTQRMVAGAHRVCGAKNICEDRTDAVRGETGTRTEKKRSDGPMMFAADHARTPKTWGPTQRMPFGAVQACMPKTVRAEGPGDRPAKGAALVIGGPSCDNRFV
jgi:hypothetical protein